LRFFRPEYLDLLKSEEPTPAEPITTG